MTFIRMTQNDTHDINIRQNHIMQNDTEQNNVYTVTLTRTVSKLCHYIVIGGILLSVLMSVILLNVLRPFFSRVRPFYERAVSNLDA